MKTVDDVKYRVACWGHFYVISIHFNMSFKLPPDLVIGEHLSGVIRLPLFLWARQINVCLFVVCLFVLFVLFVLFCLFSRYSTRGLFDISQSSISTSNRWFQARFWPWFIWRDQVCSYLLLILIYAMFIMLIQRICLVYWKYQNK